VLGPAEGMADVRQLIGAQLQDPTAERVRQSHAAAIQELQDTPLAGARVLKDRELADGVVTPIAHGLGRAPVFVAVSPARGGATGGSVTELREGTDRSKFVVLEATGWGATVTVDVLVF
jgi:hypothetical protein